MKTLTPAYQAAISKEVTTIALFWKVTRRDNVVVGFTNHTRNITIDGVTYLASSGYTPSSIESGSNMEVDNLEVKSILNNEVITEQDLITGKWDFSRVEIFEADYTNPSAGQDIERVGYLGEVRIGRTAFETELRGLMQKLTKTIGQLVDPACRADFGDSQCKVNLASHTFSGTVSSVIDQATFIGTAVTGSTDKFKGGKVDWLTGENAGLSMELRGVGSDAVTFYLVLPMPYPIAAADTYNVVRGCDKGVTMCKGYGNYINFHGEPDLPGIDQILTPGGRGH